VSGTVYRLSLLLLTLAWTPSSSSATAGVASPAGAPFISFAEQPVYLLRDTGVYAAARGARLQDGDIVASDASGASGFQVEAGAATVALGPATQVYLNIKANTADFVLLSGWMKIQSGEPATTAGKLVSASAGGLRFSTSNSAVIVHTSLRNTELFVESGEPVVDEAQAGKRRQLKLAREQFAVKAGNAKQPMKLLPRPSKQFLADMPPVFADRLVPVVAKAGATAPKLEHPAVFAEVAPWLADEPALREAIQRRLAPRKPVVPAPALQPIPR
jgi:hypothetical protein